jgi:hypothetical protein
MINAAVAPSPAGFFGILLPPQAASNLTWVK